MRIKSSDIIQNITSNDEEKNDKYVDKEFGLIEKELRARKQKLKSRFSRFDEANDKFKLNVNDNGIQSDNSEITSIDVLFSNLEQVNVTGKSEQELKTFVLDEAFDTDALRDDIIECSNNLSNILAVIGTDTNYGEILISFCEQLFSMY